MDPHKTLTERHLVAARSYPPLSQESVLYAVWNILMVFAIVYTVTYVPYKIAFKPSQPISH